MTREYDAIVYDLDNTLVYLDVDWEAARREAAGILRARGLDVDGLALWDVFQMAVDRGYRDQVESAIIEHERKGARTSERLRLADALPHKVPVGVCSLNSEAACRIALELHGLDGHVDLLAGRDTFDSFKPDPEALLSTIEGIGATPENTLFVGDGDKDAKTAQRAGVDFQYVESYDPV